MKSAMAALVFLMLGMVMADVCPSYTMCIYSFNEMNCAKKNLQAIPCASTAPPDVLDLRLDRNELENLGTGQFSGLKGLHSLHLQLNKITMISSGAFAGLDDLTTLDLSFNVITVIHIGAFSGTPNLEILSLKDNSISSIGSHVFRSMPNIETLDMENNPARCMLSHDPDKPFIVCKGTSATVPPWLIMSGISAVILGALYTFRYLSNRGQSNEAEGTEPEKEEVPVKKTKKEKAKDKSAAKAKEKARTRESSSSGNESSSSASSASEESANSESEQPDSGAPDSTGTPAENESTPLKKPKAKKSSRSRRKERKEKASADVDALQQRLKTLERDMQTARALMEAKSSTEVLDAETVRLQLLSTVNASDIRVIRRLGGGAQGSVLEAAFTTPGLDHRLSYTLKIASASGLGSAGVDDWGRPVAQRSGSKLPRNTIQSEYRVLARLPPHRHVTRFFSQFVDKVPENMEEFLSEAEREQLQNRAGVPRTTQFVVLEWHPMTLRAYRMQQPTPLPVAQLWRWARDILRGQAFLRQHGAVHRDLTPTAVGVARDGRMVICDLGYSILLPMSLRVSLSALSEPGGHPSRLAPEVHTVWAKRQGDETTTAVMDYSKQSEFETGVLLYEMAVGSLPYAFPYEPNATLPDLTEEYDASLLGRVMKGLVALDMTARMDLKEALELLSGD